ncbi:PspC family transcriptional regulator [Gracilibacillus halophilus YIM-C55.5]|uniref:PspC family transcriptional regulator n=1 Tax=Gracilibacillus halophilus YIM-C55.5 TaxID=1308866 RepID=N4WXT2_9BACI|nr:AraC family transcriptional regulator [Gracilibacillus halophilus]ENH97886.1 PspC family transcriptional regulator [Gracilibacillus halophilus YIM-C55.5]
MNHQVHIDGYSYPLVQEIGLMEDRDGIFKHPDRQLDHLHVFIYVTRGKLHVVEDHVEYQLRSGSYLFLRKGVHHWGENFYNPGSSWYYIHFYDRNTAKQLDTYSPYRQTSFINEEAYESRIYLPKHDTVNSQNYIKKQLSSIMERYQSSHPLRPMLTSMSTYQLFLDLYTEKLHESSAKKSHRIIHQMIELFHNQKGRKLTSEEIASMMGMNYSYLSSLFKEHTGKSITQYQNERIIERAIQLFKNENKNVSEVSDTLGFTNPFYFSRVFKKTIGVSPSAYLEQIYR